MDTEQVEAGAIEIEVLLNLRDYLRANYWFMFRRMRRFIITLILVGAIYPVLYFSGTMGQQPRAAYQTNWAFLIPPGILLAVIVSVYFGSKKSLSSNRSLQQPIHYTFTKSGIDSRSPSSFGHQSWDNLREAFETRSNFILFLADKLMYVVPKRCFNDEGQLTAFKELLRDRLGSRAKLKK